MVRVESRGVAPSRLEVDAPCHDTKRSCSRVTQADYRPPGYREGITSATKIQKCDAKIDEYEISVIDESEAFFALFCLVEQCFCKTLEEKSEITQQENPDESTGQTATVPFQ